MTVRDPLDPAGLTASSVGGMWRRVRVREEVGSTNAEVARLAAEGAPHGTVVTAESQSTGRGRAGREWVSPPRGGIAVSMLLRPTAPQARWSWLPLLAGVALAETVETRAEVPAHLKWPNDLLVGPGHKTAGILAEVAAGAVALGVGLNVTLTREELPRPDTTSLLLAGARLLDRTVLLAGLLRTVERWYTAWDAAQGDPERSGLRAAYLRYCHTVGRNVSVWLPDGERLDGAAVDIDADGRLCVESEGRVTPVAAGDVHHVRLP
ncbi:BirA family biotin operon repressor/biotin-[acetyl-CoA-carboxylase] ligase [Stackebrandtia albiflava]|uniref:biotin--[biotin carboxyl-carrier protein] ligase n=1 Tax=Stackebrandtia albiflava TaxID=406432 RepID=A0A562V4F1_9ACTN|nr:biotin--[acetyl-CoA-carboxylase] ligase [Stackebrandtia albiflava]TWJ12750.1 BirA family biotin operon repressor/biotin-[acetyl-CoA-carboxylase] ligase [Stackebrandtia albiflava]